MDSKSRIQENKVYPNAPQIISVKLIKQLNFAFYPFEMTQSDPGLIFTLSYSQCQGAERW